MPNTWSALANWLQNGKQLWAYKQFVETRASQVVTTNNCSNYYYIMFIDNVFMTPFWNHGGLKLQQLNKTEI